MKKSVAIAAAALTLLAIPAGLTLAQSTGQSAGPDGKGSMMDGRGPGGPGREGKDGPRGWHRSPPSPAMMERMIDGKIAGVKAALKLTTEQEKLWPALEKAVRENAAERIAFREKMRAEGRPGPDADLLKGLDIMSERMAVRATQTKKVADALRPLYGTLSDEQKDVLRWQARGMIGGMMGHGRHGGGHGGWQRG